MFGTGTGYRIHNKKIVGSGIIHPGSATMVAALPLLLQQIANKLPVLVNPT
jgi:hypothetical protein